ncbi:MAG: sugar phosphate isomerase/epimerase [Verrucomicrobiae bacterium]|nr:sugar phosphate isomerase/epimerase [Verrucomicrobiae bacterium]
MAKIKIGINMEFVRHADKSFEWGAKKAAELGYRYIEPCFLMGTCLLSNAGYCHLQSLDTDPEYFKDFCAKHKLKISGVSSHSDLLDTRIGVEYARKGIMYARALADRGLFDTPPVVQICETMYPPKWMKPNDAYAVMKMNLRPIMDCCADNGVYLGVEPHGPYTAHTRSMLRILELNDSPWLRVNFDTGNAYLAGEDPYEFLRAVKDRLIHLHAKDISVAQSDAERGKVAGTAVGCACGDGVIDWAKVAKICRPLKRDLVFSVECGTVEQAERSLKHLQSVLQ